MKLNFKRDNLRPTSNVNALVLDIHLFAVVDGLSLLGRFGNYFDPL